MHVPKQEIRHTFGFPSLRCQLVIISLLSPPVLEAYCMMDEEGKEVPVISKTFKTYYAFSCLNTIAASYVLGYAYF